MLLISLCTIFIFGILIYGSLAQRSVIDVETNESRLVLPKATVIAFVAVLVLTSTVRYGFIDTFAYKYMYTAIRGNLDYINTNGWGIEAGWLYLLYILNFISGSPKLMLFLSALAINAAYVQRINNESHDVCFSLLIYYATIYMGTNNGLRQYVAAAILIFAFPLLENRQYIKYIFWTVVASLLHTSAVIGVLICIIVSGKALNKKVVTAIAFSFLFLLMPGTINDLLKNIFKDSKYLNYLDLSFGMGIMRAICIGFIPLLLLFAYYYKKKKEGYIFSVRESLLLNFMCLDCVWTIMGLYMQYWARFGFYTSFASVILIPKLIHGVFNDKDSKAIKIIAIFCYVFFFCYNVYTYYLNNAMTSFYIDW